MKRIFFLFFITLSLCGLSQEDRMITVKGIVTDIYKKPIVNVNISIVGSSKGTKSDVNGMFFLKIKQKATTLKISHISYYTKNKMLVEQVVNDTLKTSIQLTQKINQLESFEITEEKIELLYKKHFVPIYDYEFYEDKLLLLVKELNVTKLSLTDEGEIELISLIVPNKTKGVARDCFGNTHLLSSDSAYQIEIDEKEIKIVFRISISKFNNLLKPCITDFKNTFIFKQKNESKDIVYYYLDENKKVHYLRVIRDDVAKRYVAQREGVNRDLDRINQGVMGGRRSDVRSARELLQELGFLNHILNKIKDSPLLLLKDTVYIFDHPNNTCWVFDENLKVSNEISIEYHHKKGWRKELIVDEARGEVYARYEKGGLCYLKKIDLATGKIIKSYKLEEHTYPISIKIKNNTAYYLYKDHFNNGAMSLYKQILSE